MPSNLDLPTSDSWYQVTRIHDRVYSIGEPGHHEEVFSFLVIGDRGALLVDTGCGFYSLRHTISTITKLPCSVINTHSDFDHVGCNFEFEKVSLLDHPLCRDIASNGYAPARIASWADADQFPNGRPSDLIMPYSIPPFAHASFLSPGQTIELAPLTFEVWHTPGHTDDSISLFERNQGWLFCGDLLYDGPIFIEAAGGLAKYRASIEKVTSQPEVRRIFCCHNNCEFSLDQLALVRERVRSIETEELEQEVQLSRRLRLVPC